jgi:hypothetical protein
MLYKRTNTTKEWQDCEDRPENAAGSSLSARASTDGRPDTPLGRIDLRRASLGRYAKDF